MRTSRKIIHSDLGKGSFSLNNFNCITEQYPVKRPLYSHIKKHVTATFDNVDDDTLLQHTVCDLVRYYNCFVVCESPEEKYYILHN